MEQSIDEVREQSFRWLKYNLRELQIKGIWDVKKVGLAISKLTKLNHMAKGTYDPEFNKEGRNHDINLIPEGGANKYVTR